MFIVFCSVSGVCDPYDSEQCKDNNNWQICQEKEFDCPGTKEDGNFKLCDFDWHSVGPNQLAVTFGRTPPLCSHSIGWCRKQRQYP